MSRTLHEVRRCAVDDVEVVDASALTRVDLPEGEVWTLFSADFSGVHLVGDVGVTVLSAGRRRNASRAEIGYIQ